MAKILKYDNPHVRVCSTRNSSDLPFIILQPMGFLAKTIPLLTITLKWLYLTPSNLVAFCFYLLDTFWQNFSKIDSPGGGGGLLQLFLKGDVSKN